MTQEALKLARYALTGDGWRKTGDAIRAIDEALAQPQQEPVAVWELFEDGWDSIADLAWMEALPIGTKLYTSPPQRKPLTHEEIWDAIRPLTKSDEVCRALVDVSMDEYRAIEAAHGIKE